MLIANFEFFLAGFVATLFKEEHEQWYYNIPYFSIFEMYLNIWDYVWKSPNHYVQGLMTLKIKGKFLTKGLVSL